MKKLYALAAAVLLVAAGLAYAAVGDEVLSPIALTAVSDGPGDGTAWTKVNTLADGYDERTFSVNSMNPYKDAQGTSFAALRIFYNGDVKQNDWLVSPLMELEAGKTYEASFMVRVHTDGNHAELVELYLTKDYPTAAGTEYTPNSGAIAVMENVSSTDYAPLSGKFTPEESGSYYLAAHVYGSYKGGIYFAYPKVVEAAAESGDNGDNGGEEEQPGHDVCLGKDVPYASNIALTSSTRDEDWNVINNNSDTREWSPVNDSNMGGAAMQYYYHGSNAADDYLVSPLIHLEGGQEYVVSYKMRAYSATYKENLRVYLTTGDNASDIAAKGVVVADYPDYGVITAQKKNNVITPAATGDYRIVFYCYSGANKYYLYVNDFSIVKNEFAPAAVSNLTAVPAADRSLQVELNWTLPTKDVFGNDFQEGQEVESVEIYRDDVERPIATLTAGEDELTSFTDNDEYGLEAGKHTYEVFVTVDGVRSAGTKVGPTTHVGPFEPVALPADFTVNEDEAPAWSMTNAGTNEWNFYKYYSTVDFRYTSRAADGADDATLYSPEFKVDGPGYFTLKETAQLGSSVIPVVETALAVKKDGTYEEVSKIALDWTKFGTNAKEQSQDFYIPAAGVYVISTRACNPEPATTLIHQVKAIKVSATEMTPKGVTDVKAQAGADEAMAVELSWTNPTLSTAGTELAEGAYYVELYRGSDKIATFTAGESSYTDSDIAEAGAYTYTLKTLASGTEATSEQEDVTVTSSWVGPRNVDLPYSVYFTSATDATKFIWEAVDHNEDGATWALNSSNSNRMTCMQPAEATDGLYQYDDYLLSPIFTMEPGYYEVKFQMYGRTNNYSSSYSMYMNVGMTPAGEFVPGRTDLMNKTLVKNSSTSYHTETLNFHIEEAGEYQLVFAADELNYQIYSTSTYLALSSASVQRVPVLPTIATDVTVTPADDETLSATISWTNPETSSISGVEPVIERAVIFRDDNEIGEVTENLECGSTSEFIDESVPTAGVHTYKVELYTADGRHTAAATEVTSPWIGGGIEAPYEVDGAKTTKPFYNCGWEAYDANKDGTTWYGRFILDNNTGANYEKNTGVDDYLVSPPLDIKEGEYYEVKVGAYLASGDAYVPYPVDAHVGFEGTPDTWNKVTDFEVTGTTLSNHTPASFFIKGVNASEPALMADEADEDVKPGSTAETAVAVPAGKQKIALHISNTNMSRIMFRSFNFTKDESVTGIESIELVDGVSISGGVLSFAGTATDVRVYDLSGKLVSYSARAEGSVNLSGVAAGVYIVKMELDGQALTIKTALR